MSEPMVCGCENWASMDIGMVALTGHHEHCSKRKADSQVLQLLIHDLVRGMEMWANEEDGIYPGAWDAYKRAKTLLLEIVEDGQGG